MSNMASTIRGALVCVCVCVRARGRAGARARVCARQCLKAVGRRETVSQLPKPICTIGHWIISPTRPQHLLSDLLILHFQALCQLNR